MIGRFNFTDFSDAGKIEFAVPITYNKIPGQPDPAEYAVRGKAGSAELNLDFFNDLRSGLDDSYAARQALETGLGTFANGPPVSSAKSSPSSSSANQAFSFLSNNPVETGVDLNPDPGEETVNVQGSTGEATVPLEDFEQLLGKLEGSKMRQQRQKSVEGRRDIYSQGLASMMGNF